MKKIIGQNKTEYIQFRLPSDVKLVARLTAQKYFGGNMSSMFRYALHRCDFEGMGYSLDRNMGRVVDVEHTQRLADLHRLYTDMLRQLSGMGTNLNQLAHHANAMAVSGEVAVSGSTLRQLNLLWEQLNSLRSSFAASWKNAKDSKSNHTKERS